MTSTHSYRIHRSEPCFCFCFVFFCIWKEQTSLCLFFFFNKSEFKQKHFVKPFLLSGCTLVFRFATRTWRLPTTSLHWHWKTTRVHWLQLRWGSRAEMQSTSVSWSTFSCTVTSAAVLMLKRWGNILISRLEGFSEIKTHFLLACQLWSHKKTELIVDCKVILGISQARSPPVCLHLLHTHTQLFQGCGCCSRGCQSSSSTVHTSQSAKRI